MSEPSRNPPVAPIELQHFKLRELPGGSKVQIQALPSPGPGTAFDQNVLPSRPNTSAGDDPCVLWRSPDHWLAYSSNYSAAVLQSMIARRSSANALLFTDLSAALTLLELTGAGVAHVLMRDCTLDLEGEALDAGRCAHTLMAHVDVTLRQTSRALAYHLFVERSVSQYLRDWLADSAELLSLR